MYLRKASDSKKQVTDGVESTVKNLYWIEYVQNSECEFVGKTVSHIEKATLNSLGNINIRSNTRNYKCIIPIIIKL